MAEKEKKMGIFARFGKYLRDTRGEFKKIIWPTKEQVRNNTIVVLVVVAVSSVLLFALDTLLGFGLVNLLSLVA
ncbi:preprotein translocase subunit SecE [Ruminococcaceae bacterium OttesenSCG-928-N02]|nr:preprotein translocase subunit SecE [Ruminococcaceae bacterium OttesenSCG-928-N02]